MIPLPPIRLFVYDDHRVGRPKHHKLTSAGGVPIGGTAVVKDFSLYRLYNETVAAAPSPGEVLYGELYAMTPAALVYFDSEMLGISIERGVVLVQCWQSLAISQRISEAAWMHIYSGTIPGYAEKISTIFDVPSATPFEGSCS